MIPKLVSSLCKELDVDLLKLSSVLTVACESHAQAHETFRFHFTGVYGLRALHLLYLTPREIVRISLAKRPESVLRDEDQELPGSQ